MPIGRRGPVVAAAVLVVATVVVFANTLHNSFVLDDFYRVVNNPGIHHIQPWWRHFVDPRTMSTLDRITQFRPLLPLTLSFSYALGGEQPPAYHVINIALQCLAAALAFFVARRLLAIGDPVRDSTRRDWIAFFAALVFAVHPISGILVNYISGRDVLLMEVSLLGALVVYLALLRGGDSWGRWTALLGLLTLSLLGKENAIVFPALVFAAEITLGRQRVRSWLPWRRALLAAIPVAAFFLYTKLVLHFSDSSQVVAGDATSGGPVAYALTQARLHVFHYLRNVVWPFPIRQAPLVHAASIGDPGAFIGAVVIIATLFVAWRLRHAMPVVAFCILGYWILMIPESSVIPLHQLAVDYRPYPSTLFLYIGCAAALDRVLSARVVLITGAAATAYFGVASVALNRTWRSGEALWSHSVAYGGDALAHLNLAMSIADRRDPRVRRELETAIQMSPGFVVAHIDLGLLLIQLGDTAAGLAHVEHAVVLEPAWAQSRHWLAVAYKQVGRTQAAVVEYVAAANQDPKNVEYLYDAALAEQQARDDTLALTYADRAAALERPDARLEFLRGFSLQRLGRTQDAIDAYRRSLALEPAQPQVRLNLIYAFAAMHDCSAATAELAGLAGESRMQTEGRSVVSRCMLTRR